MLKFELEFFKNATFWVERDKSKNIISCTLGVCYDTKKQLNVKI